ncbi:BTAD domain-containing putative transcriptional regulator [Spirillospora sp. NPDC029432]|uniref:BTAD domain-containing putative transcriptional regulator n=1 Tax=Spirillospora sp. NPDC029432 TaxID=3154599 RepID=UPI003454F132
MRFGVLGSLEVRAADGSAVRVPETKVRALLAVLLVHRGRPVPADRLIEALWGAEPPGGAAKTLRAKVSQLRRALAEAGARDLLVFSSPGYLLGTGHGDVDADRFEDLLRRARGGDPRRRAALLAEALELWRGEAFAGFADEEFARAEAQRLEQQRLVAVEDLAEARLELGEHALLAGELGALVGAHPLRERLRAAHVRALYLSGRQSEALAAYAETRDLLRDELGLDPGPELAALHQAILRQDAALEPRPVRGVPGADLPAPLTELIGREEIVQEVRGLLAGGTERLVTLTGPGGVGKTRVAYEAARRAAGAFPGGVPAVELAALAPGRGAAAGVVEAVAAALGVRDGATARPAPEERSRPLLERLVEAVRPRRALLVLDNCEHVVEPVAELVAVLLREAPELRVLATGQDALGIMGERLRAVPPLDLPAADAPDGPGELERRSSAVRLFVARAAAAAPGFALDVRNAADVVAICRRLDGIPLALELAATRVRAMGVRELAARLDDRFRVLSSAPRGVPPRQRTLRAVIDWSWELLSGPERAVLRRLAAHTGGCTLSAAEAVCAGADVRADEVVDLLGRLVERSLVVLVETPGDGVRYRLLESVAAYARERLAEAGESEGVRRLHRDHYIALAERAAPLLRGHEQRRWLERLDAETANLRAALAGALEDGAEQDALRLVNALGWYWFLRGRFTEAHRSFRMALSPAGDAGGPAERANAQGRRAEERRAAAAVWRAAMALLVLDGSDPDPLRLAGVAVRRYDEIDDPAGRAWACWLLGYCTLGFGAAFAGSELVERALREYRALGDRWGAAAALSVHAEVALYRGEPGGVRHAGTAGAESRALFRELGDGWGELQAVRVLGELAEITGDHAGAERVRRDGLRVAEDLGLWNEVSGMLARLGRVALLTGDHARSAELHRRARDLAAERSFPRGEEYAEIGLGMLARRQGRLDDAERHLRAWLDWCRRWEGAGGVALILAELGFAAEARGAAGEALALHREGLAAAHSTGDRRALALALEGLAGARALAGEHERAAWLLGAAHAARASTGVPLPAAERGDVDRIAARVREALGDDAYGKAFEAGQEAPVDDAVGQESSASPLEAAKKSR